MEPRRRLAHDYRVRFDEADAEGRLRASGFLRYAQDIAWWHSEEAGFGREWYDQRGLHWLVRNVQLEIAAPVRFGQTVRVETEVTGWRQIWARRHTVVGQGGQQVASIDTDWVLLGDDGRASRVPPAITRAFAAPQRFRRQKVELPSPAGPVRRSSTHVRSVDIDPLRHMNHAAYLDVIDDAVMSLPEAPMARPRRYRVGYVQPALPGDPLELEIWVTAAGEVACRISNEKGRELTRALLGGPAP